jgi:hypothetical protein
MSSELPDYLSDLCRIEEKLLADGTPICPKVAAALADAKVAVAVAKAMTKNADDAEKQAEFVCTAAGISIGAFRRGFTADMPPTVAACKKVVNASNFAYTESIASRAAVVTAVAAYKEAVAGAAIAAKQQADREFRKFCEVGRRNADRLDLPVQHAKMAHQEAIDRAERADPDLAAAVQAEVEAAKAAFDILNAAFQKANRATSRAASLKM